LKLALEQLLGGARYHMVEVFGRPEQRDTWRRASKGEPVDWEAFLAPYVATVDWPAAAFWGELSEQWPDAMVLLSSRTDAAAWWKSAEETIFAALSRPQDPGDEAGADEFDMITTMFSRTFTPDWRERDAAMAAYEAHNAEVRASVPPGRLVDWHPGDGWEPICAALGVPVPGEPFPHVNTTSEFRSMTGLDAPT
jgi:hypothetical protein